LFEAIVTVLSVGIFASIESDACAIAVVYAVLVFPALSASVKLTGISLPLRTSVPPLVTVNCAV